MKRLVSAFLPIFFVFNAIGQNGNEWIQYDQTYFKIHIGQDGLYKITYDALLRAGLPASADPETFQLFHRGKEQAILVGGGDDGVFNIGDYVEFYGKRNDGTLDSTLYENAAHQPHRYYNLYSDTAAYFLTYGSMRGKRISTVNDAASGLSEESFHWAEKLLIFKETYSPGMDYGNVHKTSFDAGEGWMGLQILQNQEVSYVLDGITDTSPASGKPIIELLLTGRGPMAHYADVYAGSRLLSSLSFQGYESYKHSQEIEWSDIDSNGKVTIRIRVTGAGGPDRLSAGYIRLWYPQQVTLGSSPERLFVLPANVRNVSLLKIANPVAGLRVFDISDPSEVSEILGNPTPASLDVVVPSTSTQRTILATAQALSPTNVKRVTFRQINPSLHNYIIVTHPVLRKPAGGYVDPVKAFAEYRAIPEGGGFDTLIVNIEQLYDQFNYGEPSPRAIFQFMKFCATVTLPDYLFLIGKGLDVNYGYRRRPEVFATYKDLVPSAGYPASDMAFTAGLSGQAYVPGVATGRLTATTAAEVAAYLNKVKEQESLPFRDLNRKKILHLSGGIEESEPVVFRNILQEFQTVAEDVYLGGRIQAIAKQSTDVKLINIAEEVNNGLGLITFFGHSAPNTTDFDIGLVSDPVMGYDNAGRYPFLLMNGCDAGSFFLNATILGENWVKSADRGAVGLIAHSAYGLVSGLQRYSGAFYDVAFGDSVFIKKGIGKVQQEVAKRYTQAYGVSPLSISQIQQMVLLGDPAVKLFGAQKPDYAIEEDKISITSFDGENITALADSFQIHIPIANFGIAKPENIRIEVIREFDNDQTIRYDSIFPGVLFTDTLTLIIRNLNARAFGINAFTVHVDADNIVDELSETNNTATFEYFIPLNRTQNLHPYNYSIVRSRQMDLSFQYTDLLADSREFVLEIDTASTFDSGFKQQFRIVTKVLGRQSVPLLSADSMVYYWRTKIAEPLENESQDWAVSSFVYIHEGQEGWAQMHFPQFQNNVSQGLVQDPELKQIHFQETVSDIAIKTFSSASGQPRDSVSIKINGAEFNLSKEGDACRNNTINLIAFDRRSTQPYAGLYFKWYELLYEYGGRRLLCGREPYVINSFTPQELITGNQDDLAQYVDNVAEGDSVVLFNIGNAGYDQWHEAAKTALASFGISTAQLDDLENGDPVIIFGRKGTAAGTAKVFRAPSPQSHLEVEKTIVGRFTSGSMSSVLIGPALRWEELIVKVSQVEPIDHFSFSIVGIKIDGTMDTLKSEIDSAQDLSFINAGEYPFLRIVFEAKDEINLTAVQLVKWFVIYEPVAEGLVFYRGPVMQQVVAEGQPLSRDFGFINISDKSFPDSLSVRYNLVNVVNPGGPASSMKISPPSPGDTTVFTLSFNTVSKGGMNDVEVFVNPRVVHERTYDNNFLVLPEHVEVVTDKMNPIMEVTFDGRYLENNEFVASNPSIVIKVWDENSFIRKTDTTGVKIFLAYPCDGGDCAFVPIHFSRSDVHWKPATDTSAFQAEFLPRDLANGTYVLRIEATDASGNPSGEIPYQIAFKVEHNPTISVSPAYPNPFYLETNLEVELTGKDTFAYAYNLQLMSVNGRLVAELSEHREWLHIGTNRIKWDGLDGNGKSLPNGIYFYRLLISGGNLEKEVFGKVVLLR